MPNSSDQNKPSAAQKIATFGLGAMVGALAAGAAWYFSTPEEEERQRPHRVYQSNHPVNAPVSRAPNNDTDEKDEKDGTVKVCEICFASFAELKECGVQIVSTPCGHLYCRDCIVGALAVKPECPHCRGEVHEATLRRLYL